MDCDYEYEYYREYYELHDDDFLIPHNCFRCGKFYKDDYEYDNICPTCDDEIETLQNKERFSDVLVELIDKYKLNIIKNVFCKDVFNLIKKFFYLKK